MCVYSNVLDHFSPLIPQPTPLAPQPTPLFPWTPALDLTELRKLLEEFRAAMAAAKTVDRIVGHARPNGPAWR